MSTSTNKQSGAVPDDLLPNQHHHEPIGNSQVAAPNLSDDDEFNTPEWLRKLEPKDRASIVISIVLAVVGAIGLVIYGLQSYTMNRQLDEMKGSGQQTERLLSLYQQQLDQLKTESSLTGELATHMKDQAEETRKLAVEATIQAKAAKELASQAGVQADASKASADTAVKSLIQSQRPWLLVKRSLQSGLRYDQNGANLTIHYIIINVGHSPAVGVFPTPKFVPMTGAETNLVKERNDLCRNLPSTFGATVYPGDPFEINETFTLSPKDLIQAKKISEGAFLTVGIVDCVSYGANFTKDRFHVGGIFELMRSPIAAEHFIPPDRDIPLETLVLSPEVFFGEASD